MSKGSYASVKTEILKLAKEILESRNGSEDDLCELQYYLGDIDCNENGVNFNDGESYTPDEIVMMTFEE